MQAEKTTRFASALAASALLVAALVAPAQAATRAVGAAAAVAATPSAVATGAPVKTTAGGPVDVQIWPGQEGGQTVIITAVEVPAEVKLPATVRVPLMPGTTVQWAGEVLGGDPNNDPERTYVLRQGVGGQFAEFKLSQSRRAQVDSIGTPLTVSGDKVSVDVQWVQSVSSVLTALSVRIPANVSRVSITPAPVGAPSKNAAGETLYVLNPKAYALGEKQAVAISYSTKPPSASSASGTTPLLVGLGVALAVAVIALIVVVARQNSGGGGTGDDGDDGEAPPTRAANRASRRSAEAEPEPDDDSAFSDFD